MSWLRAATGGRLRGQLATCRATLSLGSGWGCVPGSASRRCRARRRRPRRPLPTMAPVTRPARPTREKAGGRVVLVVLSSCAAVAPATPRRTLGRGKMPAAPPSPAWTSAGDAGPAAGAARGAGRPGPRADHRPRRGPPRTWSLTPARLGLGVDPAASVAQAGGHDSWRPSLAVGPVHRRRRPRRGRGRRRRRAGRRPRRDRRRRRAGAARRLGPLRAATGSSSPIPARASTLDRDRRRTGDHGRLPGARRRGRARAGARRRPTSTPATCAGRWTGSPTRRCRRRSRWASAGRGCG